MAEFAQSIAWTHQFLLVNNTDHLTGYTGASSGVTLFLGKNGATGVANSGGNAAIARVDATNLPGVFSVGLTATDLNTLGSLSLDAFVSGSTDHTTEFHQVRKSLLNDILAINASGQVFIASNVKQGQPFVLPFLMTVNGVPTASLTGFNAQRSLAGAGFAPCVNTVSEIGGTGNGAGNYALLMAAADSAAAVVQVHITASGADDRNITVYMQP